MDLLSLQHSQRFNDLDSSSKDIMKAILNTRNDISDTVAVNQATGLHYATGNAGISYLLMSSPCSLCKRFSRTSADARIKPSRGHIS